MKGEIKMILDYIRGRIMKNNNIYIYSSNTSLFQHLQNFKRGKEFYETQRL